MIPILLIEDQVELCEILKDTLSLYGFDVTYALNGDDGYKIFTSPLLWMTFQPCNTSSVMLKIFAVGPSISSRMDASFWHTPVALTEIICRKASFLH